jgi:hypothetical protein
MHFHFPSSNLVTTAHPFVLALDDLAGTRVDVSVELRRSDATRSSPLRATLVVESGSGRITIAIDAARLGDGEYEGVVAATAGTQSAEAAFTFFRLPEPIDTDFPFGIYAVPFPDDTRAIAAVLDAVQATGINVICQHMSGMGEDGPALDLAARRGIRFMPSDNLGGAGVAHNEAWLDRLNAPDTPEESRWLCFNQPQVRAGAAEAFARHLADYRAHPGFSGLVYYGDDLFMRIRHRGDQAHLSCYCDYCRADFAARSGQAPPVTTPRREGVVPTDDLWLQWMRYRCRDVFGGFIQQIDDARRRIDSSVLLGMCHGFPQQPFCYIGTGIYSPLSMPTPVISSYAYPYMRSPRADLIGHYEIGKMGNRHKAIWMLGAFNSNGTLYPAWQVYQNYWNMLAAGYKFIGFFSWWDIAHAIARGEHDRVQDELDALTRCGRHKDWVLPAAKHWEVPVAPFALLYSFTTEAFDLAPTNRGYLHTERVLACYREALRQQVPLEIICEEEIVDGILDRYQAVCLCDARALPETVHRAVEEYIARGGTVLQESDLHSYYFGYPTLTIHGAHEMSAASMIAVLRDRSAPAVTVAGESITARRFTAGTVEYHIFVNSFTDRYWGTHFRYDSPEANYQSIALVRDEPVTGCLRFADGDRWLFDLATGEAMGSTAALLTLELEPSWGCALVALPCRSAVVAVQGDTQIRQGACAHYHLEICSERGQRIAGAFSVRIALTAPSGQRSRWGGFLGIANGQGDITLPIGCNDECGEWLLTIEGGFPRTTLTCPLRVDAAVAPPGWLRQAAEVG